MNQLQNQAKFFELYGFAKVLGCIDGTHVPILAPPSDEDLFVNFHSINIQAMYDSDLKFIDVVAKWPGCTHDAFIWRQSGINQRIVSEDIPTVNGWFLGDSGYHYDPVAADGGGERAVAPPPQKYSKNLVVQLSLLGPKFRLLFVTRVYEASGGSRGG